MQSKAPKNQVNRLVSLRNRLLAPLLKYNALNGKALIPSHRFSQFFLGQEFSRLLKQGLARNPPEEESWH
jgi:hypothetical protein